MTRNLTLIAAAAATALTSAAPVLAKADSQYEPTTRIVKYDDLDLASAQGRKRLNTRVRMAANVACGFWSSKSLSEKRVIDKCRKAAMAKAEPQIAAAIRDADARYARAK
jgi:UrcA family protein